MKHTLFHGTTSGHLPSIRKYGLKYTPANAWQFVDVNGVNPGQFDEPGFVYLASDPATAQIYASLRTEYVNQPKGEIYLSDLPDYLQPATKLVDTPKEFADSFPVILAVTVDEAKLDSDPNSEIGIRHKGPIALENVYLVMGQNSMVPLSAGIFEYLFESNDAVSASYYQENENEHQAI